jgi:hypothetical protein
MPLEQQSFLVRWARDEKSWRLVGAEDIEFNGLPGIVEWLTQNQWEITSVVPHESRNYVESAPFGGEHRETTLALAYFIFAKRHVVH